MRSTWLVLPALALALGCNKVSPETAPTEVSNSEASPYTPPDISPAPTSPVVEPLTVDTSPLNRPQPELHHPEPNATPQQVVATFLEATRAGNDALASALLTRKALEETTKKGLTVQPPGSPSMSYQIGKIEAAPDQRGVYVSSEWTDQSEDGESESFEVVWVLRQEPVGWRIAGMAAQLEPNELPLFLNFEEPTELARKMNEGKAMSVTSSGAPVSLPAVPSTPVRQAQQPGTAIPR